MLESKDHWQNLVGRRPKIWIRRQGSGEAAASTRFRGADPIGTLEASFGIGRVLINAPTSAFGEAKRKSCTRSELRRLLPIGGYPEGEHVMLPQLNPVF
jgi:hypothetical protein